MRVGDGVMLLTLQELRALREWYEDRPLAPHLAEMQVLLITPGGAA